LSGHVRVHVTPVGRRGAEGWIAPTATVAP